jgi:cytochrome oxidase assembly protein ShyY1
MPINRNRRHLPYFIGWTALAFLMLLFLGCIAMTVIVDLLPYVHT